MRRGWCQKLACRSITTFTMSTSYSDGERWWCAVTWWGRRQWRVHISFHFIHFTYVFTATRSLSSPVVNCRRRCAARRRWRRRCASSIPSAAILHHFTPPAPNDGQGQNILYLSSNAPSSSSSSHINPPPSIHISSLLPSIFRQPIHPFNISHPRYIVQHEGGSFPSCEEGGLLPVFHDCIDNNNALSVSSSFARSYNAFSQDVRVASQQGDTMIRAVHPCGKRYNRPGALQRQTAGFSSLRSDRHQPAASHGVLHLQAYRSASRPLKC